MKLATSLVSLTHICLTMAGNGALFLFEALCDDPQVGNELFTSIHGDVLPAFREDEAHGTSGRVDATLWIACFGVLAVTMSH